MKLHNTQDSEHDELSRIFNEERERCTARRALVFRLITPMAAATTKRGKPVFEPAAVVERAVAIADALIERLEADDTRATHALIAELKKEAEDDEREAAE
jgi:hypothetical protein